MSMTQLFPGLPELLRSWEVTVTVPRDEDDGDGLVPAAAPQRGNVTAVWTAGQATVTVSVKAPTMLEAAVLGLAAAGEWARMPGARADVRQANGD